MKTYGHLGASPTKRSKALSRPRKKKGSVPSPGTIVKTDRGFDGAGINRLTSSWLLSGMSADSEIRQNLWPLRQRCRDLERNNDYTRGFGYDIEANTIGSEGVVLQMKIKEEADRVIHDPTEKQFILEFERLKNERRAKVRSRLIRRGAEESLVREIFGDVKLLHRNGNRAAKVLKGQPDVYACDLIEKGYKRAGLRQNFTVSRDLTRHEGEKLWLRSTWRDGACLVRKVKGFDNEFGYANQFIDIDWLDINYNTVLENGNEVRMGKEFNRWKECVAYHILVRQPGDWQWSTGLSYNTNSYGAFARQRVDASEIIHGYVRERVDQSREIPWLVSVITRLQMLGKMEEAELVASLLSARKTGTWYSDLFADGMETEFTKADDGEFEEATEPGQDTIAPYGWKYQLNDPKHPNANLGEFRKVMLQGVASALPGSSYHRLSQDPSGLSFSNLRGIEIQTREAWMMIQTFMRDNFHVQTFEPWLESALMSGAVPLPVSKFDKFNQPYFIFRRWKGVDPVKEADANKLNLFLANITRTKIAAESGYDFEELIEQLVLEEDLLEVSGLDALLLENLGMTKRETVQGVDTEGEPGKPDPTVPAKPAPAATASSQN